MNTKKQIGIISGMGTRAGLSFLDKLIALTDAVTDQDFPDFILHNNSSIPDRTEAILKGSDAPLTGLIRSVKILNHTNVDIIVATCITSYYFLNRIKHLSDAKFIDPVLSVLQKLKREYSSVNKVGLLATTGTLNTKLFHNIFSEYPVEIITLDKEYQENFFMKSIYMENGLKSSKISMDSKNLFQQAVHKMLSYPIDLLIGGCSEVQLGLQDMEFTIPYIDVMDTLAEEVMNEYNKS